MSTGLTFVSVWDYSAVGIVGASASYTFNDYSEAVDWSLYTARSLSVNVTASPFLFFVIYTTSPNQNGYVDANSASPSFVAFD